MDGSSPPAAARGDIDAHLERIERDGFTIFEGVLDAEGLAAFRAGVAPYLGAWRGRNAFEGRATERVYTLAGRGKVFEDLASHPAILALVGRFLAPGFLLSASHAICIHPGEAAQGLHFDDSFYPIPRPRAPIGISVIGAIDAFTEENGATLAVPGSHRWGGDWRERSAGARAVPLVMPAGAAAVFAGTLIHGAGANRSAAPRMAFTNQYCQPWCRTQENFFLGIPRVQAAAMSPAMRSLLGYSLMPPFMGEVTGYHPAKALAADWTPPIVRQAEEGGRP